MTEQTMPQRILPLRGGVTASAATPDSVTDPVAAPEAVTGAVAIPEVATGSTSPLSPTERTRLAVAHWAGIAANGAGQLWLNPGRLGHTLYHGKPSSMAEHVAYVKSRAWVPPELGGKAAKVLGWAGVVFYSIAAILQVPLLILKAALDRALRLTGLVVLLIVLAVFVLPHI